MVFFCGQGDVLLSGFGAREMSLCPHPLSPCGTYSKILREAPFHKGEGRLI